MKTLASLLLAAVLTFGVAAAQDLSGNANHPSTPGLVASDVTGFHSPPTLGPVKTTNTPKLHPNLKVQGSGVFVDGAKYGTQLINPCAPASYGMGEKYLAAPSPTWDLQHESARAAHHDAGGIKLFGLEF